MSADLWMRRALELALKARGWTSPNPMVGAVIVKDGQVVGEGYHQKAGLPHAEIEALKIAREHAQGATLYVNLEPCAHHGKTPPCVEAIIQSGIRNVVTAMVDPNPLVNQKGVQVLRHSGIDVEVGLLEREARKLNEVFIKWITTRTPFIMLKYAMTLDGKIATSTGDSRWISNEASREHVHRMRSWTDAVLVGSNTVKKDDPLLTARISEGKNPTRIVLDSNLTVPLESRIFNTVNEAPTWVISAVENRDQEKRLLEKGIKVFRFPGKDGHVDLKRLYQYLGEHEVTSILVEGGATVFASFVRAGLADKCAVFIAPKWIGDGGSLSPVGTLGIDTLSDAILLKDVEFDRFGEDIYVEGYFRFT